MIFNSLLQTRPTPPARVKKQWPPTKLCNASLSHLTSPPSLAPSPSHAHTCAWSTRAYARARAKAKVTDPYPSSSSSRWSSRIRSLRMHKVQSAPLPRDSYPFRAGTAGQRSSPSGPPSPIRILKFPNDQYSTVIWLICLHNLFFPLTVLRFFTLFRFVLTNNKKQ